MTDKNQTVGGRTLEDHAFAGSEFWCYFEPKPGVQCGEKKSRHVRAEADLLTAAHSRGIREGLERAEQLVHEKMAQYQSNFIRDTLHALAAAIRAEASKLEGR